MFYQDYRTAPITRSHTTIIVLSHAYLEYSDLGYERTVDLLSEVVWG